MIDTEIGEEMTSDEATTTAAQEAAAQEQRLNQAVEAALSEHRQREAAAGQRLRDLQVRTGKTPEQLSESVVQADIERAMDELYMTREAAEQYVAAQQSVNLYRAREAEERQDQAYRQAEAAYSHEKRAWMSAADTDDFDKRMYLKYADEIDRFTNRGRPNENGVSIKFEVARDYIMGQHRHEIMAALNQELAQEKERVKTTVQKAKTRQHELPDEVRQMALEMDVNPHGVAQARAARLAKRQAPPATELESWAQKFGLDPKAVSKSRKRN